MFDYGIFHRSKVRPEDLSSLTFDVLLSAFNGSNRVSRLFDSISAPRKFWVLHEDYEYSAEELPSADSWVLTSQESEVDAWEQCLEHFALGPDSELAIDITGMMRPHLLVLPLVLQRAGFSEVTFLYSDPVSYVEGSSTTFTKGPVEAVSVVPGFAGSHQVSMNSRDSLIVGAGYDHKLVKAVVESKRSSAHYLLVGMPGLQPHMYQESVYRISQAQESINDFGSRSLLYAPANNPFMTAQVLSDHVALLRAQGKADNIYLAPVGPKAQVLGFALYYLYECIGSPTSVIFPYAGSYSRETSIGLGVVHSFKLELDMINPTGPARL